MMDRVKSRKWGALDGSEVMTRVWDMDDIALVCTCITKKFAFESARNKLINKWVMILRKCLVTKNSRGNKKRMTSR